MTHAAEGTLLAFLDGELGGEERADLVRHLGACGACASSLEELRRAAEGLSAALGWLDRPAPVAAAYDRVRHARRDAPVLELRPQSLTGAGRRSLLKAAMLVLGLAAGASAAIPGSPVREWLVATWREITGDEPMPAELAEPVAPAAAERVAGFSVLPLDGAVRVRVSRPAPNAVVRVRLVDSDRAAVYALGEATSAHFETGPGYISVSGGGAGEIRIDLPQHVRDARVELDGRPLMTLDAGRVRLHQSAADSSATELLFRID